MNLENYPDTRYTNVSKDLVAVYKALRKLSKRPKGLQNAIRPVYNDNVLIRGNTLYATNGYLIARVTVGELADNPLPYPHDVQLREQGRYNSLICEPMDVDYCKFLENTIAQYDNDGPQIMLSNKYNPALLQTLLQVFKAANVFPNVITNSTSMILRGCNNDFSVTGLIAYAK